MQKVRLFEHFPQNRCVGTLICIKFFPLSFRETEWLFATEEGQRQLGQTAGFDRLVVVLLHREHTYGDLEAVKDELSGKVLELAPPGLGDNKQVGVGLQRWKDGGMKSLQVRRKV